MYFCHSTIENLHQGLGLEGLRVQGPRVGGFKTQAENPQAAAKRNPEVVEYWAVLPLPKSAKNATESEALNFKA